MAFLRRTPKPHPHHGLHLHSDAKKDLLSAEEKSSIAKKAKEEYAVEQKKKAEESEKKIIKTGLASNDAKRKQLIESIEREQKAIENFRKYMEKEMKESKEPFWGAKALMKVLNKFGIVWNPKAKVFKLTLSGKKLWAETNAKSFFLFHPFGFLQEILAIPFKPNFVITRKLQRKLETGIAEREENLRKRLEELKELQEKEKK